MKYDIYFHNDFDGRASAAVVLAFLRSRGDEIEHFVPVKYDIIPEWIDEKFFEKHKLFKGKRNPAIIVDFPYHPVAAFWFDHHLRPFRKDGWEGRFKPDRARRYDDSYKSACHLAMDSLRDGFGWKPPAHIKELAKWLDVIDYANYRSARQTIAMKEPAIQANTFIENNGADYRVTVMTVRFLSEKSIGQFVKISQVWKKINTLRKMMAKSIDFYRKHLVLEKNVVMADLTNDPTNDLAHFAPYDLYPKSMYVVRFHPFPGKPNLFHINVGANPWRRKENKKNIGELMKHYGGGGHKDVGGAEIVGRKKAEKAVAEMVAFLNAK